ncbi:GTP-binding protein [Thioalkalivibrio thiocyanodenitrificans]|uniref:GTP-binding protein n=1 Tax=Thioalkalivibrio thiocyanodenitrificans TaxID=243063 RepID=UPI00035E88C9|nr:ATP/GTP-binding protein [Thioalkalivibrio thiocyanodenitrificans]
MSEIKLIFTGPPGAGKTTAIGAISEIPPVSTDVDATDELLSSKDHTTAAMDFGEVTLDDGTKLRLYGTPGQRRFAHMWQILVQGGLGLIILLDNSRPAPLDDLEIYLDNFADFIERTGVVIAVTRADHPDGPPIEDFQDYLEQRGLVYPVLTADIRRETDVLMLLNVLLSNLEFA